MAMFDLSDLLASIAWVGDHIETLDRPTASECSQAVY